MIDITFAGKDWLFNMPFAVVRTFSAKTLDIKGSLTSLWRFATVHSAVFIFCRV